MGSSLRIHPFFVWTHQLKQYSTEFMTAKNTICKYNDFRISGEPWALEIQGKNVFCAQGPFWQAGRWCYSPGLLRTLTSHTFLSSVCLKGTGQRDSNPLFYMQTREACKLWACGPPSAWGYHQRLKAPCYLVSKTHCRLSNGPGGWLSDGPGGWLSR